MILTGGHWQYIFAIDHNNKARLFAIEKLFNNHAVTGFAKGIASQHIAHCSLGFLKSHGNNYTLTRSQTISLDNNRRAHLI